MIRQIVTMALALCVGTLHTAAQQVTPFKAGDRVAFVGKQHNRRRTLSFVHLAILHDALPQRAYVDGKLRHWR